MVLENGVFQKRPTCSPRVVCWLTSRDPPGGFHGTGLISMNGERWCKACLQLAMAASATETFQHVIERGRRWLVSPREKKKLGEESIGHELWGAFLWYAAVKGKLSWWNGSLRRAWIGWMTTGRESIQAEGPTKAKAPSGACTCSVWTTTRRAVELQWVSSLRPCQWLEMFS